MRVRAAVMAVVMLAGLTTALASAPVMAAPAATSSDQLQFFNMSARLVKSSTYAATGLNWRAGFHRMAEYPYLPDVISVLEVPLPKRKKVLLAIEEALGANYGWVHSDSSIPVCTGTLDEDLRANECGNTMIAFRIGRIAKHCEGCGVKSWAPFNQQQSQPCAQRGNETHMMVRLLDREQAKILTVVPVHFDPGLDISCLGLNIKKLNDMLEADPLWRDRPMTVVLGDFNEHPDPRHDDGGKDDPNEASWRKEEQKACWYKRFSLQTADDGCDPGASGTGWSFPYSEAIGLRNGTGTDDICSEWTFSNKFGLSAGPRADADLCNPEGRKRKRIDHIWVRYETSDGAAITEPSSAWIDAQIVEAAVDRGWYDPPSGDPVKYSDHRMMHARFSWCAAQSAGFATPCS